MKLFLWISFSLILLNNLNAEENSRLVWPQEPDLARIEYISYFSTAKELGIKKGFFAKLNDFVFGKEDMSLSTPFGLYVSGNRIYTTDVSARKVYIFDKEDNEVITLEGSNKEAFSYPVGVVIDKKENIYVSDSIQSKIYVFKKNGDFDHIVENVRIKRPVGIAISSDDKRLYIVDAIASQIHVTTLDGKFLFSIGNFGKEELEFNRPTYIDIGNDDNIYITDSMNHRVQILDRDGKYINSFGHIGQEIGSFANPRGISVDSDGNIYVSDTLFNAIQIFNNKGQLLMAFGGYGSRRGEFSLPINISISKNDTIYISDTNNKRVQIFKRLNVSQ